MSDEQLKKVRHEHDAEIISLNDLLDSLDNKSSNFASERIQAIKEIIDAYKEANANLRNLADNKIEDFLTNNNCGDILPREIKPAPKAGG